MKSPLLITCLFAPVLVSGAVVDQAGTEEFFEKRIRPLFMEHCVGCHGADKQKGSLRLDHQAGWQNGGDSGPALVPGKIDESLLWKAVSYEDRDLKMPPKKKLSESQMEDLKAWIASGAHDPRTEVPGGGKHGTQMKADGSFWSFQTPVKPKAPEVKKADWAANDIDRFILAKLEASGLTPSVDASEDVLMRRLSFDLTGLPPSSEDGERGRRGDAESQKTEGKKAGTGEKALESSSPRLPLSASPRLSSANTQDIEAKIDAMLASPAFAERWASHFMDMSRFAESSGGGRSLPFKDAWRFRDYLIESIRDNAPLDQMVTEMIAGDLLTAKTAEERRRQLTATGFLALGPTNYEEQDKGMLRMDIVDEQLDTIGKSFLGMTIGCARCHDHKFDPIPTRDYYALAGIMRSTKTLKNYTDNVAHWIDTPLPFEGEQEAQLVKHEAVAGALEKEIAMLKDQLRDAGSLTLRKKKSLSPADLPGIVVDDSEAQKVGEWRTSNRYPPFVGGGYQHDNNQGKGEKTLTFTPKLPVAGRYEVRVAYSGGPDRPERLPATVLHADGEDLVYFKQATEALDGLQFATIGTWRFEANGQNFVMISNAGAEGFVTVDAVQFIPADADMPDMPAAKVSTEEKDLTKRLEELGKELKKVKKNAPGRPEVMSVADDTKPEDARVHIRGSTRNLGAPVPRGFLQVAMKGSAPAVPVDQSGRLQLAQWMTSREHPLTSRVLVNRAWHWLFGAGIVRTTDNFGVTGELPSHPELLDYLAVKFMEEGWSLKKLVKEMVMSRTYRQSSEVAAGADVSKDPDNRLLSRMNRKRLDAECLRDAMLAAAGTMDGAFGGPNVSATKVDANDQKIQNLEYGFTFEDTRRSVYTAAFRNVRHPLFEVFDFADINQPIGQRTTSTVATQALFMMNNPKLIEQARSAATRVLGETTEMSARVTKAYQISLSREPSAKERELAQDYLEASISGNATDDEVRDVWARLIQTLWATPEFRYLR